MHNDIKKVTTSTGEELYIIDDVFEMDVQNFHSSFAEHSLFSVGGASLDLHRYHGELTVKSLFDPNDMKNFGILDHPSYSRYSHLIGPRAADRSWILLSNHASRYSFHPDAPRTENGKTLLYYINTHWDADWGGETLFCNSYGEVEIAVSFKPNRIVIFDSHIPHKPAGISVNAYPHRYTFVAQFVPCK